MEPWSRVWKERELNKLYDDWAECKRCSLCETRNNVVFGEGNADADIMFIGEAPGSTEDSTGRPFVGSSGELFDVVLAAADVNRCDVFITNLVGCRPPGNRNPTKEERLACLDRVYKTLYIIDPLIVVTLGKVPLQALAKGRSWSIESVHGSLFSSPTPSFRTQGDRCGMEVPGKVFPRTGDDKKKYHLEYDIVPLYHPAYLARQDSFDKRTKEFSPNGLTHNTVKDLRKVTSLVEQLKRSYDLVAHHYL
jgi:uracil-DNA glycosylase